MKAWLQRRLLVLSVSHARCLSARCLSDESTCGWKVRAWVGYRRGNGWNHGERLGDEVEALGEGSVGDQAGAVCHERVVNRAHIGVDVELEKRVLQHRYTSAIILKYWTDYAPVAAPARASARTFARSQIAAKV